MYDVLVQNIGHGMVIKCWYDQFGKMRLWKGIKIGSLEFGGRYLPSNMLPYTSRMAAIEAMRSRDLRPWRNNPSAFDKKAV